MSVHDDSIVVFLWQNKMLAADFKGKQDTSRLVNTTKRPVYESHMSTGGDQDDEDFVGLPLSERLSHRVWKARLHGYQELNALFEAGEDEGSISVYWRDPEQFAQYVVDANVAAQEQAILALQTLLKKTQLPARGVDLKSVISLWVPALVEKGLGSSRATTKSRSMECVLSLCSYDESLTTCVELVLPFLTKKLPKLVASALNCISELIKSYQFVNVDTGVLLPLVTEPLVKLAGHADRNVRAQTMTLIVEIYKVTGKNRVLIQELLLDQLKPIQQNDLKKLFSKADETNDDGKRLLFKWQESEQQVDKDGDTLMDVKSSLPADSMDKRSDEHQVVIDPFDLLPEQTITDKLPVDFHDRINSAKWKDRVEALSEFWDGTLSKVKKLRAKGQDYSEILSIMAHIVQKDANVQAVTIAAQCIQMICAKLRTPGFTKHYVTIVFVPLLERTKEKKPSVIESIRQALRTVCQFYNPLSPTGHNEDLLQELLQFMTHKTPQIKMESTALLTFIINELQTNEVQVLRKYLDDEITPVVLKIVNDTQPTIRTCGFECFANLIRLLGKRDLNLALEKLDNLKKKKIEECLASLPAASQPKIEVTAASVLRPTSSHKSTIPTKRGPSSPLQKNTKASSPSAARSRVLLTSRSLTTSQQTPPPPSAVHTKELEQLHREKQEWIRERSQLLNQVKNLTSFQTELSDENDSLREQLKMTQTNLHEKGLQLRSKELQLTKLQDRVAQLESELRHLQQQKQQRQNHQSPLSTQRHISSSDASAVSTNLGVRSLSSSSFEPKAVKTKHSRTPSESSDDLPRRVDSLQLNTEIVNEESWKRAAEVTSQLKARIERMRAKSKGINNNV